MDKPNRGGRGRGRGQRGRPPRPQNQGQSERGNPNTDTTKSNSNRGGLSHNRGNRNGPSTGRNPGPTGYDTMPGLLPTPVTYICGNPVQRTNIRTPLYQDSVDMFSRQSAPYQQVNPAYGPGGQAYCSNVQTAPYQQVNPAYGPGGQAYCSNVQTAPYQQVNPAYGPGGQAYCSNVQSAPYQQVNPAYGPGGQSYCSNVQSQLSSGNIDVYEKNPVSKLNDLTGGGFISVPRGESEIGGETIFMVSVIVNGTTFHGTGKNQREAKEEAAKTALLQQFNMQYKPPSTGSNNSKTWNEKCPQSNRSKDDEARATESQKFVTMLEAIRNLADNKNDFKSAMEEGRWDSCHQSDDSGSVVDDGNGHHGNRGRGRGSRGGRGYRGGRGRGNRGGRGEHNSRKYRGCRSGETDTRGVNNGEESGTEDVSSDEEDAQSFGSEASSGFGVNVAQSGNYGWTEGQRNPRRNRRRMDRVKNSGREHHQSYENIQKKYGSEANINPNPERTKSGNLGNRQLSGSLDILSGSGKGTRQRKDSATSNDSGIEEEVFMFLVEECQGYMKFGEFKRKFSKFPPNTDIDHWFSKPRYKVKVFERGGTIQYIAPFLSRATYCLDYTGASDKGRCDRSQCVNFHICKYFMSHICRRRGRCKYSHNFSDEHNLRLREALGLETLSNSQMCALLQCRYPQICSFPADRCKDGDKCPFLHICHRYIIGKCTTGPECRKGHSFETAHNMWILALFRMEKWVEKKKDMLRQIIILPWRKRRLEVKDLDNVSDVTGDLSHSISSDSADDYIPVLPVPPQISRKDRFKDMEDSSFTDLMADISNIGTDHEEAAVGVEEKMDTGMSKRKGSKHMSAVSAPDKVCKSKKEDGAIRKQRNEGTGAAKSRNRREDAKDSTKAEESTGNSTANRVHDDDADKIAICHRNLDDSCQYKSKCKLHHRTYGLPFLWQMKIGDKWTTFPQSENENIEKHFCDCDEVFEGRVAYNGRMCTFRIILDDLRGVLYTSTDEFDQQTESCPVRRLSTASYIKRPTGSKQQETVHDTFHTQWRWYFKDDSHQWVLYDSDKMQYTLESKFHSKQTNFLFPRENYRFKYRIDFEKLVQLNIETRKERHICRRPLFVSSDLVQRKNYPQNIAVPPAVNAPNNWTPVDRVNQFELVDLDEKDSEYQEVIKSFDQTMRTKKKYTIENLYRVQNPHLWREYQSKRENMIAEAQSDGRMIDERQLFHGTQELETCRGICTNSFDFRINGKNGTVYGEGAYFARDATYSHNYTRNLKTDTRLMFRAKVLVGKSTKGHSTYRRPPELPGQNHKLYDSCVDDIVDSKIFVIFATNQCYPEYLIAYKKVPDPEEAWNPNPSIPARRIRTRVDSSQTGALAAVSYGSSPYVKSQISYGRSVSPDRSSKNFAAPSPPVQLSPTRPISSVSSTEYTDITVPRHTTFSNVSTSDDHPYAWNPNPITLYPRVGSRGDSSQASTFSTVEEGNQASGGNLMYRSSTGHKVNVGNSGTSNVYSTAGNSKKKDGCVLQ